MHDPCPASSALAPQVTPLLALLRHWHHQHSSGQAGSTLQAVLVHAPCSSQQPQQEPQQLRCQLQQDAGSGCKGACCSSSAAATWPASPCVSGTTALDTAGVKSAAAWDTTCSDWSGSAVAPPDHVYLVLAARSLDELQLLGPELLHAAYG